jgi:hypothetical protein
MQSEGVNDGKPVERLVESSGNQFARGSWRDGLVSD